MFNILIKSTKIIIVILIFYYLYKNNHFDLSVIEGFSKNYVLSLLLITVAFILILLGALRWHLILKSTNLKVSFFETFKILYICSFFNNVLFGTIGGDVLRVYYVANLSKKNKIKNSITILIDRVFGLSGLCFLGFISFLIILYNSQKYEILFFTILSLIFVIFIFLFLFKILRNKFDKFNEFIKYFRINKKILFLGFFISVIVFFLVHLSTYFISNNIFDFEIGINIIFFSNFISTLMSAIPLTPGGVGLGELSFTFINRNVFDIYLNNLANVIIYLRIIDLLVSLPSLVFYLNYKKKYHEN